MKIKEIADVIIWEIRVSVIRQRRAEKIRPPSKLLIGKRFRKAKVREASIKYATLSCFKSSNMGRAKNDVITLESGPHIQRKISSLYEKSFDTGESDAPKISSFNSEKFIFKYLAANICPSS